MSITSDIRAYADTAFVQGKQVVGQAQAQITDVTGQANQLVSKLTGTASDAVSDLRSQAEKAINLAALKSAVEPYLAQAKQYRNTVTDLAEGVLDSVRNDKRVAKVVATAESLTGVVVDTVNERLVKPVSALTGRGSKLGRKPAAKSTARKAPAKAATTRPAVKKAPAKKATATSTARKAPAKKATQS